MEDLGLQGLVGKRVKGEEEDNDERGYDDDYDGFDDFAYEEGDEIKFVSQPTSKDRWGTDFLYALQSRPSLGLGHLNTQGRKAPIWKALQGTPKQLSSVECGYYVMRFMKDIITNPSLEFEKKFEKGKDPAPYPQEAIEEVRKE
ncbi:hypothetical protein L3X38_010654 [Prunus dulcis]|uniref:Ubiquitin-like protease family profile domain-containing protein n=1 Tax=Prunus dulcis TaxID=3755 RepID=A0AAD4WGP5_PRUDU|nr:hypothetical protein L3X38_010654 [Prunus dulcis]